MTGAQGQLGHILGGEKGSCVRKTDVPKRTQHRTDKRWGDRSGFGAVAGGRRGRQSQER